MNMGNADYATSVDAKQQDWLASMAVTKDIQGKMLQWPSNVST